MRSRIFITFCCLLSVISFCDLTLAQIIGGGGGGGGGNASLFATNNSGFVQTGVNGPDNLILFEIELTPLKDPDLLPPLEFTIIGNLQSDQDADGDGANDSLGSFSGLEWSTGSPGVGTLIGCVLNEGNGSGEFYQINPLTAETLLIGQSPMVDGEQADFSDLSFNPVDGLMYGLMNTITDDNGNGNLDFGPVTIWVDTDGDLVPDTQQGGTVRTDPFCAGQLFTLASGMTFLDDGTLFVYDNIDEELLAGGLDSSTQLSNACVVAFADNDTGFDNTETAQGNGLGCANGAVILGSDVFLNGNDQVRNTVVSFYEVPEPMQMETEIVNPVGVFPVEFFQTGFQAAVSIGDLVGATADLDDLPPTFPDALIVNRGIPLKNAVLEGIVASDDFRYCIAAQSPVTNASPVDVTVVFTIPNGANVTTLGVNVESNSNAPNIEHSFAVANVNTQQFEPIGSDDVTINSDGMINIDLSLSISDYVDPSTGQLVIRIGSDSTGINVFFPWQVKFDSIIAVSE